MAIDRRIQTGLATVGAVLAVLVGVAALLILAMTSPSLATPVTRFAIATATGQETQLQRAQLRLAWPLGFGIGVSAPERYLGGGAIVVGAVALLIGWPAWLMHRTGQDPNPYKPTPGLLAAGPYRATRNPMYLAMVLACIGVAVLLWNLWIVLLTPVCALVLHYGVVLPEEAYLERKFGEVYGF